MITDETLYQMPKNLADAVDIYIKENRKAKVDKAYEGYERCFKMDICVGCPYSELVDWDSDTIVYPLRCVKQLMHDLNLYIKEGDIVTEVISTNPHKVCLRRVDAKTN